MHVYRTPEERFRGLPGFDYEPRYLEVGRLRIAYVDEGPREAAPVLLLHGEPTWSFLYRHMIGPLVEAGHRVLAPDLVGFGRSDKPARIEDYTFQRHVGWMSRWADALELRRITLFGQDWGSLIGLRLVALLPDRFDRVVIANGGLPTGDQRLRPAFTAWRQFALWSPWFPVGLVVQAGTRRRLAREEVAAYDAPFPDQRYTAGARALPLLVPARPDDPGAPGARAAWQVLSSWDKPVLTAFSDRDPITRGGERVLQKHIPGAKGQAHVRVLDAGHFLQEDQGSLLARVVDDFVRGL